MSPLTLQTPRAGAIAWLAVHDAKRAHAFYERAFDAVRTALLEYRTGRVAYAALRFGDTTVVVVDELPAMGLLSPAHGGTCTLALSVADAEEMFGRAVNLGARPVAPVRDSFAGERHGLVVCPFGHRFILSTRTQELDDGEIAARFRALDAQGE